MPPHNSPLSVVVQSLPVAVVVVGRGDGHILDANRRAVELSGRPLEQLRGAPASSLFADPEDFDRLVDSLDGETVSVRGCRWRGPSGGLRSALVHVRRVQVANAPALCLAVSELATPRDASNEALRRVVEEQDFALAETERRLSTLLDNLPGLAYRVRNDRHWTALFVSEGAKQLTGYEPWELEHSRVLAFADLIHPDDRERVWNHVQEALARREPFQLQYRLRTRDGTLKWVWEQGVGVYDEEGELTALEGITTDVTERVEAERARHNLEQQMRAAQRLEALGRLAGGVAHDFNNLLTVIQSFAGFLNREELDLAQRTHVEGILEAAERAARLTGQLLAFGRRQVQELQTIQLNPTLEGLHEMLGRIVGEDIELRMNLHPDLWTVRVDVAQLEQVVMNLVVNARDAMPRGGVLTLETANIDVTDPIAMTSAASSEAETTCVDSGQYVKLIVSDTGVGMDEGTRARLFEPFFTTKDRTRGTGLGLSTVYGIVKQSGGEILVHSARGRGTRFEILLPRAVGVDPDPYPPRTEPRELGGSEAILLVEDEPMVRHAACRILERNGYHVLEASGGEEALAVAAAAGTARIDLLLTDVIMPRMSGPQLADRLAAQCRELPVLYMSGYSDDAAYNHGIPADTSPLQKPFSEDALLRRVRLALDRRDRRGGGGVTGGPA